jgi:fumarylacetoacetate (FAA) hydrolase
MKLVTAGMSNGDELLGLVLHQDGTTRLLDLVKGGEIVGVQIPSTMNSLLAGGERSMKLARLVERAALDGKFTSREEIRPVKLLAPVPHPPSCRDGYAFRQHVATARRNRGAEMIPEFDQYPIFYFTNHHSIIGEGELVVEDDHLQKLDFELEAAIVIGKQGRNISSSEADDYIAGFMIMNDFSARVLQMEEMLLSLGPAKGKDFATAVGPWLVTPDELEHARVKTPFGSHWKLCMRAFHNGKQISDGNLGDMNWTFAEIIERASYGVDLFPGDIIGSGTVGTGCYLELNGTRALEAKGKGESYTPVWLQANDTITLEIDGLGRLEHTIRQVSERRSILAKKKLSPA